MSLFSFYYCNYFLICDSIMTWKVDNCINNSYKSQWLTSRPIWLLLTGFALQCSATGDLQVSDVKMHHDSCMCFHVQFNSIVPTCTNKPSCFDTTKWWMWNQIWPSSQMFCQGHCERLSTVMPHTVRTVPNTGTVTGNLILTRPSFQVDNLLCLDHVQEVCV